VPAQLTEIASQSLAGRVTKRYASCYHRVVRTLSIVLALAACGRPAAHRDDVSAAERPPRRTAVAPASDAAMAETSDVTVEPAGAATADAGGAAPAVSIVEAPMKWNDRRARLTLEYRRAHSDRDAKDLAIEPRVIVLHYTAGGSAQGTRAYFDNIEIEGAREQLARGGRVNVSAHFLVDRDGTIYRLQPETRFARHCIGLNHIAIGIENVGDDKKWPLTDEQVAANAALVRDLAARFPITHLLGHHEVMQFRDHAYFVELDPAYRNSKGDPGARFMARVRERVADLGLAGL
jgi:N-acetylmuramoyl-L-alanine amidase